MENNTHTELKISETDIQRDGVRTPRMTRSKATQDYFADELSATKTEWQPQEMDSDERRKERLRMRK